MSAFEYMSAFLAIILGLAVIHLLGGISLILDKRIIARLDGIHLMWVFSMFAVIMFVWWANWQLNEIEEFTPLHYVSMVLYSVVLYLMCGLLFPVRGAEVQDFAEQFELNRVQFFCLGEALVVASAIKGHVDRTVLKEPDTMERFALLGVLAVLFAIAAMTRNRAYQWTLSIAFPVLILYWIITE